MFVMNRSSDKPGMLGSIPRKCKTPNWILSWRRRGVGWGGRRKKKKHSLEESTYFFLSCKIREVQVFCCCHYHFDTSSSCCYRRIAISTADSVSVIPIVGGSAFPYLCWLAEPQSIPRKGECNTLSMEMGDFEAEAPLFMYQSVITLLCVCKSCGQEDSMTDEDVITSVQGFMQQQQIINTMLVVFLLQLLSTSIWSKVEWHLSILSFSVFLFPKTVSIVL